MTDLRPPLTLICGLNAAANAELAETLRAGDPATAVVHHDLRRIGEGIVRRRVRLGARDQLTTLELAHGCVSCTLREDLLPLLRTLSQRPEVGRVVLHLDEAMEPERVVWSLTNVLVGDRTVLDFLRIDAVVATVDVATWLGDATGDAALSDRGLHGSPDDERTLAQVALAQVESADVLALHGTAPDAWTAATTAAVLDRVASTAPRPALSTLDRENLLAAVPRHARRGAVADPHGTLLHGQPPLDSDCGIALLHYTARRPFHPERLHEAIDTLLDGVVRTRGRVWVASQPDVALWVESAGGGLGIGHAGPWLAADDGPAWDAVSPERRTLASLRWDPVFGDRAQELVVVTQHAAPSEIRAALDEALLTDAELADGEPAWRHYPDPFGEWHAEPCEDTETTRDDVTASSRKENGQQ
ncbi:ribosome hibernation factor-recruiting GTPase MRF [Amycolatopsis suaedae]|uniref:Cobalamin biosynthesis protein CobW n=1 Tax=Amycolatopsis suaedae TaxID=2510978 RepID=A0A4Q7J9Q9_9PSEU|nr:GTP-binding protein [Amycolatopsis suaedae]RZQ63748.1 cobalamin biosynthesis protein CobW [Amycolatopsis suaedae]